MTAFLHMTTLENQSKAIFDFRCKDGTLITIDTNTCADVRDELVEEILAEFPYLKMVNISNSSEPIKESLKMESEFPVRPPVRQPADGADEPVKTDPLSDEVPVFVCSMCDKRFNSANGMRIHLGKAHP